LIARNRRRSGAVSAGVGGRLQVITATHKRSSLAGRRHPSAKGARIEAQGFGAAEIAKGPQDRPGVGLSGVESRLITAPLERLASGAS
jgi:hypothetical protein